MKSFPKIIQETQIRLPPHNKVKFFGHGFRNSSLSLPELNYVRGEGKEEERKRRGKRSEEEMKRSRWGGGLGGSL